MKKLLNWLLDLLYPPKCIICRKLLDDSGSAVCLHCLNTLPDYDGADPRVKFADRCAVTFFYEEPLRASILRFKFGGMRQYAVQYGRWMAHTVRDKLEGSYDLLSWAPVSDQRRRERGFDQAELLCREAGRVLEAPVLRTLTKRVHTPAQSGLNDAAMRAANVRGAYVPFEPDAFRGKRILLIDDIVTTGSTLSECCRVLLTAGAERVVCAALAAPRKEQKGETL